MKLIKIIVILTFTMSVTIFGQEKALTAEEQAVIDVISKLNDAEMKDDTVTADSLIAEQNLAMYGPITSQILADKKQLADMTKSMAARPATQFQRLSKVLSDFKVSLLGENAVVLAKEILTIRTNGRIAVAQNQFTYFMGKKEGKWRVIAWQMLPLSYGSYPRAEQIIFDVLQLSEKVKGFAWKKIAEDSQGDGLLPISADGKSLSYFWEKESDMLWFKFELHNDIDKAQPAVSLSIDIDSDQKTGTNWWGTISEFKYDKVLNLGISEKICDTKVRGYNGITSHTAAINGNWLNEKKNNLIFHGSPEEKAYYLGVKRADIGAKTNKIRIVGSVGANSVWNDDIGQESVAIILEQ